LMHQVSIWARVINPQCKRENPFNVEIHARYKLMYQGIEGSS
jgi:hypothetical protein